MDLWTLVLVICSATELGNCQEVGYLSRPMPIEECMVIVQHVVNEPRRTHTFVCSLTHPNTRKIDERIDSGALPTEGCITIIQQGLDEEPRRKMPEVVCAP